MPILKPHEVQTKRGVATVVRENPLINIRCLEGNITVQCGKIMWADGSDVDPVPDWFWAEYAKISPAMREQLGVELKAKK